MTKELEEAFADWWNSDYLLPDNPYEKDSKAYWAWEGYVAGVKAERDACAKALDAMAEKDKLSNYYRVAALAIRARGQS